MGRLPVNRRRACRQTRGRCLWIALLILGLGHTPLPVADSHPIRHLDGAGQSCPQHDHLVRWHGAAEPGPDTPVLHWHWLLAAEAAPGPAHQGGPALHSPDLYPFGLVWDDGPHVMPDATKRWLDDLGPESTPSLLSPLDCGEAAVASLAAALSPRAFTATFGAGTPLTCLLQRRTC